MKDAAELPMLLTVDVRGPGFSDHYGGDSRELYDLANGPQLVGVAVTSVGANVILQPSKPLFDTGTIYNLAHAGGVFHSFAVTRDGQHFIVTRPATLSDNPALTPIAIVFNCASNGTNGN